MGPAKPEEIDVSLSEVGGSVVDHPNSFTSVAEYTLLPLLSVSILASHFSVQTDTLFSIKPTLAR